MRTRRGDGDVRPLVDLVGDHLDRNRVLARPCHWPEGPQPTGHFIFSSFFFPAAIIVAYLVHDRTEDPGGAMAGVS